MERRFSFCQFDNLILSKGFLLTPHGPLQDLMEEACYLAPWICDDVIEFMCGPHMYVPMFLLVLSSFRGAFNNSRMDVMAGHEPGGTSTQNMKHWFVSSTCVSVNVRAQLVRDKNFQMYDWGEQVRFCWVNEFDPPGQHRSLQLFCSTALRHWALSKGWSLPLLCPLPFRASRWLFSLAARTAWLIPVG